MLDKLMKLKEMKQGMGEMRPVEKNAKMSVLKDLIGEAGHEMGSGLRGMKKVSVMAPDSQSLEAGLSKAKQMVGGMPQEMESDSDEMSEDAADMAPGMHEGEQEGSSISPEEMEMSAEELDHKIQALMKLKEDKMSSHRGM